MTHQIPIETSCNKQSQILKAYLQRVREDKTLVKEHKNIGIWVEREMICLLIFLFLWCIRILHKLTQVG